MSHNKVCDIIIHVALHVLNNTIMCGYCMRMKDFSFS